MAQSESSGSQYALSALGIGMLALGIIMMVWGVVPGINGISGTKPQPQGNTSEIDPGNEDRGFGKHKNSSVAYVLVGVGVGLLMLSICMSIRSKKRRRNDEETTNVQGETLHVASQDHQQEDAQEDTASRYSAPSYDEVMRSDPSSVDVGVFDQNNRNSTLLPSYESLVEGQGVAASGANRQVATGSGEHPSRSNSRSGRRLKPLKVRRIKSDKLHLKDFRLNTGEIKTQAQISIEPLTPPPLYDDILEKPLENTLAL
ncbi:transmembrane protein 51 [Latimeria chalumnae]|uniref:Transmembrane protein 51 n=1 Tax=Latimeria chalumnae TaxID=7897 RepID=H2ZWK7_LATCH|nr:PREDICTED: transmembrane protein 51 [Latimeria chalumnae]XP_005994052.1 PREDICTED: transmembrane protein 51 [Latimeria chalumnae]|eukprot:XP_005994051.1 PREDICTED: transmembrane protein 51 [Latimeria chalumnae]